MLTRLKCRLLGHKWQQKGQKTLFHMYEGKHYKTTLNFLFFCPRCYEFKEYETQCHYETTPIHEEEEVEIEDG